MSTHPLVQRAAERRRVAQHILGELDLLDRWSRYGTPYVVGAVAYDLVVSPDIDMEVYCRDPKTDHGFEVLAACARHPAVLETRFVNFIDGPDNGYYWQIKYRHDDGEIWKVDMWSVCEGYDLPTSRDLVEPMQAALTDETRLAILDLKEARRDDPALQCLSIHLYRAVIDGGVRTRDELAQWLAEHAEEGLSDWRPKGNGREERQ